MQRESGGTKRGIYIEKEAKISGIFELGLD
jgi:hypothetical protein